MSENNFDLSGQVSSQSGNNDTVNQSLELEIESQVSRNSVTVCLT